MLRSLSVFTGTSDLEVALGLLYRTAHAAHRDAPARIALAELADYFGGTLGHAELLQLAARLGIADELPSREASAAMFRDEMLSARALKLHRGRNVYSAGKATLWHKWWVPFMDALTPTESELAFLQQLTAMKTHAGGNGIAACVELLQSRLRGLGFAVELFAPAEHAPLIVARRGARGLPGKAVLYGHYDVIEPDLDKWNTDPWQLEEREGRLYGCGVADNKAALTQRLSILQDVEECPELLWVIQGEEEIGSPLVHELLPQLLSDERATLWIEENGYFDPDGTLRLLARRIGSETEGELSPAGALDEAPAAASNKAPDEAPDEALSRLIEALGCEAALYGVRTRMECRGLNKAFFPRGCPFGAAIPAGGRYIAFGVNDPASAIHRPNESVPMWTFPIHARMFQRALRWVAEEAMS